MCREQHSTITNAHTVRRRPVRRVEPQPQLPVVDLRLLPGRPTVSRSTVTWARRASSGRFAAHLPAQTTPRDASRAVLVAQPLMDRRLRHPGLELRGDVVAVRARSPARSPAAARYRPAPGTSPAPAPPSRASAIGGPPGTIPAATAGAVYLRMRLAVHPQARRQLVLRPARIPVDQNLAHVDHVESSPRHQGSTSPLGNEADACV